MLKRFLFSVLFFVASILAIAIEVEDIEVPTYQEKWFTQQLDHFNYQKTSTFQQRYLLNDTFWKSTSPKGPIFFYTGNEGPITAFYDNSGFVFELARENNALVVFAEHRYYGLSLPFGPSSSFTPDNIAYLSVEQALADYAVLITSLKTNLSALESPVIAFGGSYGGMLTAWFRQKYPTVVDAGLAASAPILMASLVNPVPDYWQTVTNDFHDANIRCPDIVRKGFSQILALAKSPQGLPQIASLLGLCSVPSSNDIYHLNLWLRNAFGTLAMMDYPYPTNFLGKLPGWPVRAACSALLNASDAISGLRQIAGFVYNSTLDVKCFNITAEYIECSDQTGCGDGTDGLAWDYQGCTEIIYFPNTNNVTDMFPPTSWSFADLKKHCEEKWGVVPRPDWIKTAFGGNDIITKKSADVTRIIFSNGGLDPWHGGGYLQAAPARELYAVFLAEGAHHLDLRASNPLDPPSVVEARLSETIFIRQFIQEAYQEKLRK